MATPPPEPTSVRRLAVFDFDGTLARGDTLLPFLARACGRRALARALLAEVRRDRDAAKAAVLARLLTGDDPDRIAALGHDYATTELPAKLRPDMVAKAQWHRAEGHELVIVSASLAAYLVPLGQRLGFDHVIAVELDVGADGRLTGRMVGANLRGPEKAVRLRTWLGDAEVAEVWAYGDSDGDAELLALATSPVWVGRRARARRRAVTRGRDR